MIEAGEPLGTRYVVVRPVAELRPGALFEVVDRSGLQFFGQLLHDAASTPALAAEVRQALVALPALPTLLKPRDLALTPRALPVGIIERPGGATTASTRMASVVETMGRREATVWLLRQFASMAADLAQVHQLGATHGAISGLCIVGAAEGEVGPLQLSGFGVNLFARNNDPTKAPTRRSDLVDLLTALHELFTAAGLQPEGGAAAKWMLLRASAQHGEHPALASGTALAAALNEMSSLRPDEGPPRPSVRAATIAGPRSSSVPVPSASRSSMPPARGPSVPAGPRSVAPGKATTTRNDGGRPSGRNVGEPTPAPEAPTGRIRLGVVVPVLLVICAGVAAGVWYALHAGSDIGVARLDTTPRHNTTPRAVCRDEGASATPAVADFHGAEFDAACLAEGPRLAVVARKGTEVVLTTRGAQRGQRFSEAQTVARGVVELGTTLVREGVQWIAWRNGVGDPVGIARVEGERVASVTLPLVGWDSVPLRGAWLLDANPRTAWVVTNVATDGGAHAILLQVSFGPSTPDVVAWLLGPGAAEAVIPSPTPAVLLHRKLTEGDGLQHEFADVTLDLAAVASARRPTTPVAVGGNVLPDNAITRSTAQVLSGAVIDPVRHGLATPEGRSWVIARGGVRPSEGCEVPERCHSAGPVALLTFGRNGAPTVSPVAPNGWATELVAGTGDRALDVVYTGANVAGAELPFHTLVDVTLPQGVPGPSPASLETGHSPRARVIACGTERWLVYDAAQPATALVATPLACAQAH